jgi:hypothetical protein
LDHLLRKLASTLDAAPGTTRSLLPQELAAFLRVQTVSELVVDRSTSNELLKVTFNIR